MAGWQVGKAVEVGEHKGRGSPVWQRCVQCRARGRTRVWVCVWCSVNGVGLCVCVVW